jgi:hypothetical protein
MKRGESRAYLDIDPKPKRPTPVVIETEKNELLVIMSNYLTKKDDKATTITKLEDLKVKLSVPS